MTSHLLNLSASWRGEDHGWIDTSDVLYSESHSVSILGVYGIGIYVNTLI